MSRNAQEAHQTHGSPQLVALPGSNLFSHISSFSMASSINLEAWMGVIERKPPALNALSPGVLTTCLHPCTMKRQRNDICLSQQGDETSEPNISPACNQGWVILGACWSTQGFKLG